MPSGFYGFLKHINPFEKLQKWLNFLCISKAILRPDFIMCYNTHIFRVRGQASTVWHLSAFLYGLSPTECFTIKTKLGRSEGSSLVLIAFFASYILLAITSNDLHEDPTFKSMRLFCVLKNCRMKHQKIF